MGGRLFLILYGKQTVPTVLEGPPLIRGNSLFCGGWEGEVLEGNVRRLIVIVIIFGQQNRVCEIF